MAATTLDQFKNELIEMKQQGQSYINMIEWLLLKGVDTSKRSLERRLSEWGANQATQSCDS